MDLNPVLDVGDISGSDSANDAVVVVSIFSFFVFPQFFCFLGNLSSLGGTWIRVCATPTSQCVFA